MFAQSAVGTSMIAFGGLNWALDGAAAPVAAVLRLEPAMDPAGALALGNTDCHRPARAGNPLPRRHLRLSGRRAGARGIRPRRFRPASSLAIVGQNGAGKTTLAKLLCRLYDPQAGGIEVDGVDVRTFDLGSWRSRLTAVFQDFTRFELPLRDNVAPAGAPDAAIESALAAAGAAGLAESRHGAGPRLRGRDRAFRRSVAANRVGPRAVRDRAGRGRRAAR